MWGSQVQQTSPPTCTDPSDPRKTAMGYGSNAVVTLLLAQVIINIATAEFLLQKMSYLPSYYRPLAQLCYVLSGCTFVMVLLMLPLGDGATYFGSYCCYVMRPGVFAGGAILSLATVILAIVYYLVLNSAKNNTNALVWPAAPPNQAGIAMGQPLFMEKGSQVQQTSPPTCTDPSDPRKTAMVYGSNAVATLLLAQVIINIATAEFLLQKRSSLPSYYRPLAQLCYVLSRCTFVMVLLMLPLGDGATYFGGYCCYVMRPGVFAGGAILSFATMILAIVYYLVLNSAKNNTNALVWPAATPNQAGIAMGQPQFPPPNAQAPVFVH